MIGKQSNSLEIQEKKAKLEHLKKQLDLKAQQNAQKPENGSKAPLQQPQSGQASHGIGQML